MATQTQQTKLLPLPIPGTDYVVEPVYGRFVTDLDKTWLQILYQDSINPVSPQVLPSMPVRHLWEYLEGGRLDTELFYNQELHEPYGVKAEDLLPTLNQLVKEMHSNYLFVKGALVVANKSGLVLNLGDTQLPAFIEPEVYTATPVTPKNSDHGMSLDEFKEAGGRIVARRVLPASQYQLKHGEWTTIPEDIKFLGVMKGDNIYANLDPDHSDGVKALNWVLYRSDGRPSYLDANIWLGGWKAGRGVLRGRRLNATTDYQ